MRGLTLDQAMAILRHTLDKATEMRAYPLAVIVLDAGGRVKAFAKQDGASLMRFEIAQGKAYAALALHRSSRLVLQKAREKPPFMDTLRELADGPIFLEAGGQLIRDDTGEILGAVGVTGDVNEVDDLCAIAGVRGAGLKSDEDFDERQCADLNIKRGPPISDPRQNS